MKFSPSVGEIAKALAKVQAVIKNPPNSGQAKIKTKTGANYSYKYAPLPDILNDVRPLLAENGLSILQSPGGDGRDITITTLLLHESGEWIESEKLGILADGGNAQAAGAAITYGRRYALAAMLGFSSEDDDDGGRASASNAYSEAPAPKAKKQPKAPVAQDPKRITDAQRRMLYALIKEKFGDEVDIAKKIIGEKYSIQSTNDLTVEQVSDCIDWLKTLPDTGGDD